MAVDIFVSRNDIAKIASVFYMSHGLVELSGGLSFGYTRLFPESLLGGFGNWRKFL